MKIEITKEKKTTLFTAIMILIIGALLFSKGDEVVKFMSYICGALFALYGGYSIYTYVKTKLKASLALGIASIILAFVSVLLSDVIKHAIRYIIGGWIILYEATRLIYTASYTDRNSSRFISNLITSILLIILGFYIVLTDIGFKILGGFLIIYAAIEIIGYILDVTDDRKNTKPKEEIKDAVVVSKQPKKKTKKQNKKVN